jgi:hypothetical protein
MLVPSATERSASTIPTTTTRPPSIPGPPRPTTNSTTNRDASRHCPYIAIATQLPMDFLRTTELANELGASTNDRAWRGGLVGQGARSEVRRRRDGGEGHEIWRALASSVRNIINCNWLFTLLSELRRVLKENIPNLTVHSV